MSELRPDRRSYSSSGHTAMEKGGSDLGKRGCDKAVVTTYIWATGEVHVFCRLDHQERDGSLKRFQYVDGILYRDQGRKAASDRERRPWLEIGFVLTCLCCRVIDMVPNTVGKR